MSENEVATPYMHYRSQNLGGFHRTPQTPLGYSKGVTLPYIDTVVRVATGLIGES